MAVKRQTLGELGHVFVCKAVTLILVLKLQRLVILLAQGRKFGTKWLNQHYMQLGRELRPAIRSSLLTGITQLRLSTAETW